MTRFQQNIDGPQLPDALLRALFAVALVLLPLTVTAQDQCAAVAGLWFDPNLDGEGFNVLETNGALVITYYGYSSSNERLWLLSEVFSDPIVFGTDISLNMFSGAGGSFVSPLAPAGLTSWGSLTVNFADALTGQFRLNGIDGDKTAEVIKLAGVSGQQCTLRSCVIDSTGSNRLRFANDASQGIFDPSLASVPDSSPVWLSYSTVSGSLQWPQQNSSVIQNRLARSDDGGESFSFVNEINPVLDVTVALPPPNDAGSWVSEVSSLTYDGNAEPNQRWKLIWHHYLQINGQRYFEHGWLGYRSAAQADQLQGSDEIKLFAAGLYDAVNNDPNGATRAPVGGAPLIDIRDLDAELSDCAVLSEPGWLAIEGALYLSVGCFEINPLQNRMILLSCPQPCAVTDPQGWHFVATLLDDSNAQALGFDRFSAPDLFALGDAVYLWVTPVTDNPSGGGYDGCRAFRFNNLSTGQLLRDATGQPAPSLSLDGLPASFNGACAQHEAAGARTFYSQLVLGQADVFQIFRASSLSCVSILQ